MGIAAAEARPAAGGRSGVSGHELALIAADTAAFLGAMAAAVGLYFGREAPTAIVLGYLALLPVFLGWRLFCAYAFGLYDLRHRLLAMDHVFGGCAAAAAAVIPGYLALALAQVYGFDEVRVSRVAVVLEGTFLAGWFGLSRWAGLRWLERSGWRVRAVVAGAPAACDALAEELAVHGPRLFAVAAAVPLDGDSGAIGAALREHGASQLILTGVDLSQIALRDVLAECDRTGTDAYVYPELGASLLMSRAVTSVAGVPLVPLRAAYASRVYRIGKRAFDVAAAAVMLTLSAPVLALAASAIAATSRGPVLYSQVRVGRHGVSFRVYKLRTMRTDAEAATGAVLSQANDPRITAVGRWLRLLRIDEIPQLWNVLRGEMSLVGPRPERPEFTAGFRDENPLYDRRFLVRPGLTGLAQIHGRYDTDYTHKLRYDLIYISNISFASDLRILAATIQTVLTGKGAA